MNLKKTDVWLLEDALKAGSYGAYSHRHSAAARKRMLSANFLWERDARIVRGQYRSFVHITDEGRNALAEFEKAKEPA